MKFQTNTIHTIAANGDTEAERDEEYAYLAARAEAAFPEAQVVFDSNAKSVTITIQAESTV